MHFGPEIRHFYLSHSTDEYIGVVDSIMYRPTFYSLEIDFRFDRRDENEILKKSGRVILDSKPIEVMELNRPLTDRTYITTEYLKGLYSISIDSFLKDIDKTKYKDIEYLNSSIYIDEFEVEIMFYYDFSAVLV